MITGSESKGIECIQQVPNSSFQMKDLGKLNYFLGLLEVYVTPSGIYVNQTGILGGFFRSCSFICCSFNRYANGSKSESA